MRKCCCCISVHIGAAILGTLGLIISLLELVVLIPYLLELDVETFNPIQKNLDSTSFILSEMLKEQKFDDAQIQEIIGRIEAYSWPVFLGTTVEAGVYALTCLLMIIGSQCRVRGLMLPYLILQMLALIIIISLGVMATVGLFFMNLIMGVVAGAVVLVIAAHLIYFWVAVKKAYSELGNNDYMYSPAPLKPAYANEGRAAAGYYPTSPQHFQMDERK